MGFWLVVRVSGLLVVRGERVVKVVRVVRVVKVVRVNGYWVTKML
jgi:hypothetical protein